MWPGGNGFDLWANLFRPGATTLSIEEKGTNLVPITSGLKTFAFREPGRKKILSKRIVQKGASWTFQYSFYSQRGLPDAAHDDSYLYPIPVSVKNGVFVSQGFKGPYSHYGAANEYAVDFRVPENTPVYAARDGIVVQVVKHFTRGGADVPESEANIIKVQHSDFTIAEYAHLRPNGAVVAEGQKVKRGELIGYSGSTGKSTGPHLHFAVHVPISGKNRRSVPISFYTGSSNGESLQEGRRYSSLW